MRGPIFQTRSVSAVATSRIREIAIARIALIAIELGRERLEDRATMLTSGKPTQE